VRAMEDRARGGRGLQPAVGAHPQPATGPPRVSAPAPRTGEAIRPAQQTQVLATADVLGKPRSELLVRAWVIPPADRALLVRHAQSLLHSSRDAGHVS